MKPFHPALAVHIDHWVHALPPQRGWWPRFVYHFTDVRNATGILQAGHILGRTEAIAGGFMQNDNADRSVIDGTDARFKDFARLYFRPRTPTQWHNEGIRPSGQRSRESNCPVPIFFLFDALSVLSLDETEYSDGNVSRPETRTGSDLAFFQSIDFADVFSQGGMGLRKAILTLRRHAEVLVPRLPVAGHLKVMYVRSGAERQTFLELMGPALRSRWETRVFVATEPLFERRGTYVEEVACIGDWLTLKVNPATTFPGPFTLYLEYQADSGVRWSNSWRVERLNQPWMVQLLKSERTCGLLTIRLDEDLAFTGRVAFADAPF